MLVLMLVPYPTLLPLIFLIINLPNVLAIPYRPLRCTSNGYFRPIAHPADCTHAIALIPHNFSTQGAGLHYKLPAALRAGSCLVTISPEYESFAPAYRMQIDSSGRGFLPLWAEAKVMAEKVVKFCAFTPNRTTNFGTTHSKVMMSPTPLHFVTQADEIKLQVSVRVSGLPKEYGLSNGRVVSWREIVNDRMGHNLYEAVGIPPPGGTANWDVLPPGRYTGVGDSFLRVWGRVARLGRYEVHGRGPAIV